jgi:hypothetical protein
MRYLVACLVALVLVPLAIAAPPAKPGSPATIPAAAAAPKEIGRFKRWIAATHMESGHEICYAFTRAGSENPATGTGPVLSVTDRPNGRNEVAISGGPTYPKDATVTVQVDQAALDFYTAGRDAFARDNNAAVAAFERGTTATAKIPGPRPTTLSFNLDGFRAAHDTIEKACPAH